MSEGRSQTAVRDWLAYQHTDEACDLVEQFTSARKNMGDWDPSDLVLASVHLQIAATKMKGGQRA